MFTVVYLELQPLVLVTILGLNHYVNVYKSAYSSGSMCWCACTYTDICVYTFSLYPGRCLNR